MHNGQVVPARIVVSHEEQVARLKDSCPEAAPRAVIAGDPCFDRLLASLGWRDHYRAALGLRDGQRLVVVASTWGPPALIESEPDLIARLLADLPADDYRVAAIIHPGIWSRDGRWMVRSRLADCRRAGLLTIPPREGWRAALVAADCVIGDHGSVTLYGAAIGRPTLLAGFHSEEIAPGTAMAGLGRRAIPLEHPYRESIDSAIDRGQRPGIAEEAFAMRGESARILRDLMYEMMELAPAAAPPKVLRVPSPDTDDRDAAPPGLLADVTGDGGRFTVTRYPMEVDALRTVPLRDPHIVIDDREPDQRVRRLADVVIRRPESPGMTAGRSLADALATHRGSTCAADVTPSRCVVAVRGGRVITFDVVSGDVDPAVFASIACHHVETGTPLPPAITVRTVRSRAEARVLP